MSANPIQKKIVFKNHNEAVALFPAPDGKAEEVVGKLDIKPCKAVVLLLGDSDAVDEKLIPRLTQLFGRGVARAAAETEAVVIDGGTQAGVAAMMGLGVAGRGYKSKLIGVAAADEVAYPGGPEQGVPLEPNHSHFVLVEGGGQEAMKYGLVGVLTGRVAGAAGDGRKPRKKEAEKEEAKVPALGLLAGGGPNSKDEVLRAVRQGLTLIVVEGSGGLADEIAAGWKQRQTLPDDPVMAEILADGEIHLHPLSNPAQAIERLIIRELGVDKVLTQAWEVFADYDLNANIQQKRFGTLQMAILTLGVIGTALAIAQQLPSPVVDPARWSYKVLHGALGPNLTWLRIALHQILIIIPILLTVLITASNRFKQGSKWLLLRAGAESVKREIYRYRTRAMDYKDNPEQRLAERVEDITRRTMRTEVNLSAVVPYSKDKGFPPDMYAAQGGDDGFSYLTPDRYVEVRLGDQLNYFKKRAVRLERQLKALYWAIFVIGGLGTYLAAVDLQVWIALTTAVVAAVGTYLGYRQTENTLTKYNQAATDLANVKAWWNALSAEEQSEQVNIDSLVEHTEQVLQSELDGWVQQMQNSLAELRKGQEPTTEREEGKDDAERPEPKPGAADAAAGGPPPKAKANGNGQPTAGAPGGQQPGGVGQQPSGEDRQAGGGGKTTPPKPGETTVVLPDTDEPPTRPDEEAGGGPAVKPEPAQAGDGVGKPGSKSTTGTDEGK